MISTFQTEVKLQNPDDLVQLFVQDALKITLEEPGSKVKPVAFSVDLTPLLVNLFVEDEIQLQINDFELLMKIKLKVT